jgi:hypothetical protein
MADWTHHFPNVLEELASSGFETQCNKNSAAGSQILPSFVRPLGVDCFVSLH